MGKNNKQRRAAKSKKKDRSRTRRSAGNGAPGWERQPLDNGEPIFTASDIAHFLLLGLARDSEERDDELIEMRSRLGELPARIVDKQIELTIISQIDAAWQCGWQPAELHREARRTCRSAVGSRLVARAIAHDHSQRRATSLDQRWQNQIDGLDLPVVDGKSGWVHRWMTDEELGRQAALDEAVDVCKMVMGLHEINILMPPPGTATRDPSASEIGANCVAGAEADPILERVRRLLAKAESTDYEAEATAFTAKAQELMTRHAIDSAMLHRGDSQAAETPVMVRVPIEAPYVDAKSFLLQVVGEAGRCRAVFHHRYAFSTIFGYPEDVVAAEMLFTSLLVQAQAALAEGAKHAPVGTRVRSQSYRSAFLLAFTERIGDRLLEINQAVYADVEASDGGSFLPVLRSRTDEVDAFVAETFGELRNSKVRGGHDPSGWGHGRLAADNAQLAFGDLTDETTPGPDQRSAATARGAVEPSR